MLKKFAAKVSRFLFGDPEDYSRVGYYCTRCDASKEDIFTKGCTAMEPCTTAPLELREKVR